ncbi:hypothetical protein C7N43_23495 [Sphingobacteriales bacterium UPWRP_1]|nr:hypothetical protein B6N25_15625 [Sphingobacteriales bacterium TSM_CSS]PSJ74543.1 hypothetical protein C7N43_23495 [Sphingobacteriales bacterium UPWRP_1]
MLYFCFLLGNLNTQIFGVRVARRTPVNEFDGIVWNSWLFGSPLLYSFFARLSAYCCAGAVLLYYLCRYAT